MRTRLLALLAAGLFATAANAASIVTIDGSTNPATLLPGSSATIQIGITPDADRVSGFSLIFEISDTTGFRWSRALRQAPLRLAVPLAE